LSAWKILSIFTVIHHLLVRVGVIVQNLVKQKQKVLYPLMILLLLFAACDFAPPTIVASSTPVEIIVTTGSSLIETNEFFYHLPLITNQIEPDRCAQNSFGIMLTNINSDDRITPSDVMIYANDHVGIKGMVSAGAPSDEVRDLSFSKLPGWTRSFIRGVYEQLLPIHASAGIFGMQDMYECIAYGPESMHQAGSEALEPLVWVPMAKELANSVEKCLIYGPAVLDYERMATPEGDDQVDQGLLAQLIMDVSPYVDVWMVQLAKYQRWTDAGRDDDGNSFTKDDFISWITWWVYQIKTANPDAKVWTQLGIGRHDPISKVCLPPQPLEYILDYRESLIKAGVDGIFVAPSQPCLESMDPQDREYYLQTLEVAQQAIELACKPLGK
jgi:hypothetical protein